MASTSLVRPTTTGYAPSLDHAAFSLLALSEHFRIMEPPKYKMAIKCARACFKTPMSREMNAFAHLQLGKLYFYYTMNTDLAKFSLEQAYHCLKELGGDFTEHRLEAACLIAEVYLQLRVYEPVKQLLRQESQHSRAFPVLHARLLFLLAEIHRALNDCGNACEIMEAGVTIFQQLGDAPMECFFRLSNAMIISMDLSREEELMKSIMKVSDVMITIDKDHACADYIKAYCFTVQICFFISVGMLKSTKSCLRQLQVLVQTMKSTYDEAPSEWPSFDWMGKETLTALTYVLTVIQSLQNCQIDRAHKYHTIALRHISEMRRLMAKRNWPVVRRGALDALTIFEIILLENIATAQLVLARPLEAINVLGFMVEKMRQSVHLFPHFEAQAHTLMGMYCWLVRLPDDAERQFLAALKAAKDTELWTVVNLSLAIVYLMTCRESEFYGLFERITPNKLHSSSPLLRASAHFVHALHSFLHSRLQEARSHLTDSVTIVRDEGVPRIQALATLLSSRLVGSEATDMLLAASGWAAKSADQSLFLWSNHLIYELQMRYGNMEQAQVFKTKIEQQQECFSRGVHEAINAQAHALVQIAVVTEFVTVEWLSIELMSRKTTKAFIWDSVRTHNCCRS
uniref:MAU2 chromatid cohesion factor homolog n=1 Tax=Ascaris lumbricoides TaxID=6252 RepID=A0A0M3HNQ1_ASCLU